MSCNLRESLSGCIDKILGIREGMGAQLADVSLITRVWSGERVGDGDFSDSETKMSPMPGIQDFSHNIRVMEGGAVKAGDLILMGISRNKYPEEASLLTSTDDRNIEKFYKVGKHYYRAVHVKENLVTWDVHVRKVLMDETE